VSFAVAPDNRLLAIAGLNGPVHVWDVLSGKELHTLKGHTAAVAALAFAPGGKTLVSASHDTTALVWDVTKIARPTPRPKAPQPRDVEAWWQALAQTDGAKAVAAMSDFHSAPKEAVAWIKDQLKPAAALDRKRALDLINKLEDGQFNVRAKATAELLRLGELVVPVLDEVLGENPAPETRRRMEELRGKLTSPMLQGERLRIVRAVEILDHMGTAEARQTLEALASGAPGALVTTSAQAALKR
jgi:hypothetical protein